jgi:hypothetical protein
MQPVPAAYLPLRSLQLPGRDHARKRDSGAQVTERGGVTGWDFLFMPVSIFCTDNILVLE